MRKSLILSIFLVLSYASNAQTVDQIKADRSNFIWGEGSGMTITRADQDALHQIITQISSQVESSFTVLQEEITKAGKANFSEEARMMMSTYSNATLTNTERVVLSEEPEARVFRYIKRSEIKNVFEQRKRKIIDFTSSAEKFAGSRQVADALKYYYWALSLLRSHPEGGSLEFPDKNGQQKLLLGYLPAQINALLGSLNISVNDIKDNPGHRVVTLDIESGGASVSNFEYSFWDGRDWSAPIGAKDGTGFLEFFGDNTTERTDTRIKAEYLFEGEARIDRELEDVLKRLEPISFRTAYYNLKIEKTDNPAIPKAQAASTASTTSAPKRESGLTNAKLADLKLESVANAPTYDQKVEQILTAVRAKNLPSVKSLFTTEGYEAFNKLIGYGQAQIIGNNQGTSIKFGESVVYRGPKMSFSFKNNNRKFIEDVVFHFDKTEKVSTIAFALEQEAVNSIIGNTQWSEVERMTMINFLEHYKTAYALKRIDYVRSIFADDALIIVGNVVKDKPAGDNPFKNSSIIKYNRYSKEQYLKNLQHCFSSNEFINIKFEACDVRKTGNDSGRFGIQIKQNYHSTNYADQGYLFLFIDFSNPDEPQIHIRTWQPEKNPDGSIYGLEDF
ncbi:MAG: hypothetical protein PHW19_12275 [Salinivirgaceae bacterium]|nr:hypothetical protein [Salinivirgaceae bacterium]